MANEEAAKQKLAKIDTSAATEAGKNNGNAASVEERKPSTDDKPDSMDTENNNEKTVTIDSTEPIVDAVSRTDQETGEIIQTVEDGEKNTPKDDATAEHMDIEDLCKQPIPEIHDVDAVETPTSETVDQSTDKPIDDDDDVIIIETSGESEKMDADDNSSIGAPSSITTRTASERDDTSRNSFDKTDTASNPIITNIIEFELGKSPMRRGSQESSTTTTTTATTTTGSESTTSSSESTSTDSSSSDSDDTSSSEDDLNKVNHCILYFGRSSVTHHMSSKNL